MKQRDLIALMAATIYAARMSEQPATGVWPSLTLRGSIMANAVKEATQLNSLIIDEEPPSAD